MFTGIVEHTGIVSSLSREEDGATKLEIACPSSLLEDAHEGDSISVNGTCLTVTKFNKVASEGSFMVGVAPETLRRTDLGSCAKGTRVNLERAALPTTRMGGHFVQGHVDTVATIDSITPDGEALTVRFRPRNPEVLTYIVEKGYIALDGTSLTITRVDDAHGWWEVMLISYTQEKVVLATKKPGDEVNVEVDMVGKYVEKSVKGWLGLGEAENAQSADVGRVGGLIGKLVERLVDRRLSEKRIG